MAGSDRFFPFRFAPLRISFDQIRYRQVEPDHARQDILKRQLGKDLLHLLR
jgi:hypothetical protein